ncbi:unnamed protein product [Closterium sp. Yama58-4]|nr:unnamed protein product [Closterium sp. Yama58-4]
MSKRHIKADESAAAAGRTAGLEASMSFSQKLDFRCRRFVHVVSRDWQYYVPLCLNLCGSVLFFLVLRDVHVSVAVPVSNGATFAFNAAAGYAFGEKIQPALALGGVSLAVLGIALCV